MHIPAYGVKWDSLMRTYMHADSHTHTHTRTHTHTHTHKGLFLGVRRASGEMLIYKFFARGGCYGGGVGPVSKSVFCPDALR